MKKSPLLVLKHRVKECYFVGYLIQDEESGVWCAHHYYEHTQCTEPLFDSYSLAVNELMKRMK